MLRNLANHFELGIYTASEKEYADKALDLIDGNRDLFSFRLYRDRCIEANSRSYFKDLRILQNRRVQDCLLIDNNIFSFGFQLSQGIPILSFTGDQKDKELIRLQHFLLLLNKVNDLSAFLNKYFGWDIIRSCKENVKDIPLLFLRRIDELLQEGVHSIQV